MPVRFQKLWPLYVFLFDRNPRSFYESMNSYDKEIRKQWLYTFILFRFPLENSLPYQHIYLDAVSFSYSDGESQEVSMNVNRIGNKKQGETFKSNSTEITPNQMKYYFI